MSSMEAALAPRTASTGGLEKVWLQSLYILCYMNYERNQVNSTFKFQEGFSG